jgi:anti-anti-sigma factor
MALADLPSDIDREGRGEDLSPIGSRPRLRMQVIPRTAIVRLEDAEFLIDEGIIRELGQQLERLIKDDGHSRLLINLGGLRYVSSTMLAQFAWLARRVQPIGGQIQLCGLSPLLRDMMRASHLDGVLDVCEDEAQALGLIIR